MPRVRTMSRNHYSLGAGLGLALALLACLLLIPASAHPREIEDAVAFQEWQVIDTNTGHRVVFEEWISDLAAGDVIYLGEEHRNHSHIEAALKIFEGLLGRGRQPILALEMFAWDGQAGLNHYLTDRTLGREQFLREVHWERNWGGSYEDYEPLINFARERQIPVLALNPPRTLVRTVAKQGLAQALADPEMIRWGMTNQLLFDEPAYREILLKQLRLCRAGLPDEVYQRMYEASVFRDEGMAKTIAESLGRTDAAATPRPGPIVSYTGGGHIQYQLPVPNRVLRRRDGLVKQATIYLIAYEPDRAEEIRKLLREHISDYVWLTPLSAHGAPRRCG